MGVNDVLAVLQEYERDNPGEWLTVAEVKERLEKKGFSNGSVQKTNNHLFKLAAFSIADMKGKGLVHHIKLFRLHKKRKSES